MGVVKALEDTIHNYHVFWSWRGEESNEGFICELYADMGRRGFRVFRHDAERMRKRGEVEEAINNSLISIVVLSKDYISSKLCLDVLVMILQRQRSHGSPVIAVFADVDRDEVEKQHWKIWHTYKCFQANLTIDDDDDDEKQRQLWDKLSQWGEALREAANLKGMDLQHQRIDGVSKLIEKLIEGIEEWNDIVEKIHLVNSGLCELPECPYFPALVELRLQQNPDLTEIPINFFERLATLKILDLSNTSIKSLPPSISSLVVLRELYLRGCVLLMKLPPEIGALANLEVLDLEGTEIICLPNQIGELYCLECLRVSLYRRADRYIKTKGIEAIFPRKTLKKFSGLKELSIYVDPDCEWWDVEVKAILNELYSKELNTTLKLYLPTVELLQQFLQLQRISNFRLIVGRHDKCIISPLPRDLQDNFDKLENCIRYVNGEGKHHDVIAKTLKHAKALFLDRHWTIERLSEFKMGELRYCLLVQCNEMKTIVDADNDLNQQEKIEPVVILENLQYLGIHCMKNLESIWKGPFVKDSLYNLKILALHTCPKLTSIFNLEVLPNLANLKELIVEDCPEIKSLVTLGSSSDEQYFLPRLKRISLVHLPQLVTTFSRLRVAPILEKIVIYNCPNLKTLSTLEWSTQYMKEIKGDSSLWEALEWYKSKWINDKRAHLLRLFVPLGRYGDLTNELVEAVHTSLEGDQVVDSTEPPLLHPGTVVANKLWRYPPGDYYDHYYHEIEFQQRYGDVLFRGQFSVQNMWQKLIADAGSRAYVLQLDFVLMMLAFQENTTNLKLYWGDNRFRQALEVLQWNKEKEGEERQ